ncbi:hypothetical protein AB0J03_35350, partial [Streptomyces microflavus]
PGLGIIQQPGSLLWAELYIPDVPAAAAFFGAGVPASLAWLPSYFFAARKPLTTAIRLATRTMSAAPV